MLVPVSMGRRGAGIVDIKRLLYMPKHLIDLPELKMDVLVLLAVPEEVKVKLPFL